jgi:hypothetical protein
MTKTCTACGATDVPFYNRLASPDGLDPTCKTCRKKYQNAYYAKPEKRERVLLYWRKRNEDLRAEGRYDTVQRWAQIKTRYGLTKEQYDDLLLKQNNACAICKAPFTDTPCVDHDHVTNITRGLICNPCNHLLGKAKDSITVLQNAIDYLSSYAYPSTHLDVSQ